MKLLLLGVLLFAFVGCANLQRDNEGERPDYSSPTEPQTRDTQRRAPREVIDIEQLQSNLRMDRSVKNLGFKHKSFNTCKAGAGYASRSNCRRKHLNVIHFKIFCRDSEGTVSSVSQYDFEPLSNTYIKWDMGVFSGSTSTNYDGYGQIVVVTPGSSRNQMLRLTANGQILGLRAKEVSRIVVPSYWCQ